MARKVEVDFYEWHLLRNAIVAMQDCVFYAEDEEGVLRRWYPPAVPKRYEE